MDSQHLKFLLHMEHQDLMQVRDTSVVVEEDLIGVIAAMLDLVDMVEVVMVEHPQVLVHLEQPTLEVVEVVVNKVVMVVLVVLVLF